MLGVQWVGPVDHQVPVLQVASLTPSEQTLFPEADWLIGNHSDELTPWIPVMAARYISSPSFPPSPLSLPSPLLQIILQDVLLCAALLCS